MGHLTALLLRGLLLAALATAATALIVHKPHAADVQLQTSAFENAAPVPVFDTTPQAPIDDTPITPRECVAAFGRE